MSTARLIYLHAITPVHSGTGQAAEVIDLPIAREKATNFPLIPASSLKGVLRNALANGANSADIDRVFGTQDKAGDLCFTDQRILFLPVRSYFGTFAYVTCPLILSRLRRDLTALGIVLPFDASVSASAFADGEPLSVRLHSGSALENKNAVYLEDLDLKATVDAAAGVVADGLASILFPSDPATFTSRFALVSDEVFSFLSETATEITARVALETNTKTVRHGGLWYEEAVPAEAVFCAPVLIEARNASEATAMLSMLAGIGPVQIGGNASVGRGLCRVVVTNG